MKIDFDLSKLDAIKLDATTAHIIAEDIRRQVKLQDGQYNSAVLCTTLWKRRQVKLQDGQYNSAVLCTTLWNWFNVDEFTAYSYCIAWDCACGYTARGRLSTKTYTIAALWICEHTRRSIYNEHIARTLFDNLSNNK